MIEQYFNNIVRMTVVSSAIITLIVLFTRMAKNKYSAKWRYWAWILVIILMIIPINLNYINKVVDELKISNNAISRIYVNDSINYFLNSIENENAALNVNTEIAIEAPQNVSDTLLNKQYTAIEIIIFIWLAGVILTALLYCWQYVSFLNKNKRWSCQTIEGNAFRLFNEAKQKLLIKKKIGLRISNNINSPMLMGFMKPTVYIPNSKLDDEALNFIFLHELTHYKRKDLWLKLLVMGVRILYWFNPFIYILSKQISTDIELCCDEDVIKEFNIMKKENYANTIIGMIRQDYNKNFIIATNFIGSKKFMKTRIQTIVGKYIKKKGNNILALTVVISILLLSLVACHTSEVAETEDKNAIFEVYSIAQKGAYGEYETVKTLMFTNNDLKSVDWDKQEYTFTNEFLKTLDTTPYDAFSYLGGSRLFGTNSMDKFGVYVNGEQIYEGFYEQSPLSSFFAAGTNMKDNTSGIKFIYQKIEAELEYQDNRFDERIKNALTETGLINGTIKIETLEGADIIIDTEPPYDRAYVLSETEQDLLIESAVEKLFFKDEFAEKEMYPEYRYYYNKVDMNGDGKQEVFVMLVGMYFSGSGGSTGILFDVQDSQYNAISKFTLVNAPVIVSENKTNGWKDIIMHVNYGAVSSSYNVLQYDGETYPSNPSMEKEVDDISTIIGIGLISDEITPGTGITVTFE